MHKVDQVLNCDGQVVEIECAFAEGVVDRSFSTEWTDRDLLSGFKVSVEGLRFCHFVRILILDFSDMIYGMSKCSMLFKNPAYATSNFRLLFPPPLQFKKCFTCSALKSSQHQHHHHNHSQPQHT